MRVLFVTPEIYPLVKTGGLGDVSGALPPALRAIGVDARLLLPGYPAVLDGVRNLREVGRLLGLPAYPGVTLLEGEMPGSGVPAYVVDAPALYRRPGGPYLDPATGKDWADNAQRFGTLCRVAANLCRSDSPLDWQPELVHANDWQSGLVPALLHFQGSKAASVITVHNLAFQGIFPPQLTAQLGLPPESFHMNGVEYYGNLSFLKAGLFYADHITTVSPTYAREIQSEPLGFGMHGLLATRSHELTGILNGIDEEHWNPATDPLLVASYNANKLDAKAANKAELQRRLGLGSRADVPLLGSVGRITHQKGLDLLLELVPRIVALPAQVALLGTGDAAMEQAFQRLAAEYPGQVGVMIGFDEALSHLIEGGADMFLMPSRFEPCGLNQMYSMRYGTPPVVHATGGLADTVVDADEDPAHATGFAFRTPTAPALFDAVQRAVACYQDRPRWAALQRNGMAADFTWERSAQAYLDVYRRAAQRLPHSYP